MILRLCGTIASVIGLQLAWTAVRRRDAVARDFAWWGLVFAVFALGCLEGASWLQGQ